MCLSECRTGARHDSDRHLLVWLSVSLQPSVRQVFLATAQKRVPEDGSLVCAQWERKSSGYIKGSKARRCNDSQQVQHPDVALCSHSCGQSGVAAWESQLEAHRLAVRSVLAWRIISLTGDSRFSPWNLFLFRGI